MTKLLVSVRDAAEARMACDHGADLIDVKEPSRGALGAADEATIGAIVRELDGQVPLSAALGELLDGGQLPRSFAGQLQFAKFGLAGCTAVIDWPSRWQRAIERLPSSVGAVAVAYADWLAARAPEPAEVVRLARTLDCRAVLLDTFDKSSGPLTARWTIDQLERFVDAVHQANLLCVLAGSLGTEEISQVLPLGPNYVGVRGAACAGDRTNRLSADCVERLARLVHTFAPGTQTVGAV